jgi:hypothetical protein
MYIIIIIILLPMFVSFHIPSVFAWHQNLGIDDLRASELYRNNPNDPLVKQWQEAMMNSMNTADSCLEDTTGTVFTGAGLYACISIVQTILENCKAHPNSLLICEDSRLSEYFKNINLTKLTSPQEQTNDFVPENRNEECNPINGSLTLQGKILSKGIIMLTDFYPCILVNGKMTLNIPENDNLKLAVLSINPINNVHSGVLINPTKNEDLDKNQGLFSSELDKIMKGTDPITGKSKTVTKINGLALYNTDDNSIVFKPGNSFTVTATVTK